MTNVNYSRDHAIEKLGERSLKNVNDFLNKGVFIWVWWVPYKLRGTVFGL